MHFTAPFEQPVRPHSILLAASLALTTPAGAQHASLTVMDGDFDDWNHVPVALTDPADAPNALVDFGEVRIAHDDQFIDLAVELGRLANVQQLAGTIWVVLDADGNQSTGDTWFNLPGADIAIAFSPADRAHPERKRMGIGLLSATYRPDPADELAPPITLYDVGFTFAPTHANERIEMRFERGAQPHQTPRLFLGARFRGKFVHTDFDNIVRDETAAFSHTLTSTASPTPDQPVDPLARSQDTDLRIMSWNVRFGSIVEHDAIAERILRALQPDVILFQEILGEQSPDMIEGVLNEADPDARYHVFIGEGGGDLRSGIAARSPIEPCDAVEPLANPANPEWKLRTAGCVMRHDDKRILLMSLHLKCCGGVNDPADEARIVETTALQRAVALAHAQQPFDAVILGGDLNLVGSTTPLDILRQLPDSLAALSIARPYQLDGRSNATWSDPAQPFAPGRLDYLLHQDALREVRSFVLDCRDLSPHWLEAHGLSESDTETISDHWPLVLDLAWE